MTIRWKKSAPIVIPQARFNSALLVDGVPFVLKPNGKTYVVESVLDGSTVARVPEDTARVAGDLVLFGAPHTGGARVYRAGLAGEWDKIAKTRHQALAVGAGRLVTCETLSMGPDGECVIAVHELTDHNGLVQEQSWKLPLFSRAAVSERHLVLHRKDRLLAFEFVGGTWEERPIEMRPNGGGSAGIGISGDVVCISAPAPGDELEAVHFYRFDGGWVHLETVQVKAFQNRSGDVRVVGSVFFVVGTNTAIAFRRSEAGIETKSLKFKKKHSGEFVTDGETFGVVIHPSVQLYDMADKPANKRKPKDAGNTTPEPQPSLPMPPKWEARVQELIAEHQSPDSDWGKAVEAFGQLVVAVEEAWRADPAIAGWIPSMDEALSSFPEARRLASSAKASAPSYRLVRRGTANKFSAEEFQLFDPSHLTQFEARIPGKYGATVFAKGSCWTHLEALVFVAHHSGTTHILGDAGLRALAKVALPRLARLNLARCGAGDKALVAFAKSGAAPALQELSLAALGVYKKSYPELGVETLAAIGEHFSLRVLDLRGTPVSKDGVERLLDGTGARMEQFHLGTGTIGLSVLKRTPALQSLSVGTLEELETLAPMETLSRLQLSTENELQTAEVRAIARVFPNVKHLVVSASWNAVPDMAAVLPQLETLTVLGDGSSYDLVVEGLVANEAVAHLRALCLQSAIADCAEKAMGNQNLRGVHMNPFHPRVWTGEPADPPYPSSSSIWFVNDPTEPFQTP